MKLYADDILLFHGKEVVLIGWDDELERWLAAEAASDWEAMEAVWNLRAQLYLTRNEVQGAEYIRTISESDWDMYQEFLVS